MAFSENKENVTSKCVHNFLECIQEIYEDLLGIVAKLGFLYLAILIGLVDFYSPWNHQKTVGLLQLICLDLLHIRREN